MVRLFDVSDGKLIPSEHCYSLMCLKMVMQEYPEDYLKIYLYIYYMCAPDARNNPFFDVPEDDKEQMILEEIGGVTFSTEDETIQLALNRCRQLYETPTLRAYKGAKKFLDNAARALETETPTFGRDGNASQLQRMAEKLHAIFQSYNGICKDLEAEQKGNVRGGQRLAYDQE